MKAIEKFFQKSPEIKNDKRSKSRIRVKNAMKAKVLFTSPPSKTAGMKTAGMKGRKKIEEKKLDKKFNSIVNRIRNSEANFMKDHRSKSPKQKIKKLKKKNNVFEKRFSRNFNYSKKYMKKKKKNFTSKKELKKLKVPNLEIEKVNLSLFVSPKISYSTFRNREKSPNLLQIKKRWKIKKKKSLAESRPGYHQLNKRSISKKRNMDMLKFRKMKSEKNFSYSDRYSCRSDQGAKEVLFRKRLNNFTSRDKNDSRLDINRK